ncbi:MAG: tagatose 1,6-diphosphate aldolase [Anaerolineae bacterium]|nr:tagatose 1,6-diphosphate aldolase [Thermoflexales bacterium]MDW8408118.1 tagatose 1,6-diphosphate aldolase [Anaerolineae bacterium]
MATVRMTHGKFDGINALADQNGIIAAAAMDQRGSLKKAIAKARGGEATGDDLTQFKCAVTKVLTRHASAILLDPEYGLPAIPERAPNTGVLLAYEKTGYDASVKGRLPDLLTHWSVRRLVGAGADAVKVLLYYSPADGVEINDGKQAFIERIGAECTAYDVPFFLECVTYDDTVSDPLEFARRKPAYVIDYMAEFSKPHYGVDVLKVEVPVDMSFVEGTRAFKGTAAYTRQDAMRLFREAASAAGKPFIYLSAGVSDEVFRETLELAAEAGTHFAGVLCGRATWQDGIPIFAREGLAALENWLEDRGVKNIQALNAVLAQGAKPWWTIYGGRENIEVI